ncbi:MFS transporter [Trujillonella endophytica]|uniref:Dipeptide/tripeptide permease n=1 Tax=Trujillonella endophytica TaxID=673521 RepID=A0A1H8THW4_9ACTN|nr:MFS transporter [Trujillella endophytica]SEO90680.1 Dipeptide/tripeptide permease [Trujillella endophytica]
MDGDDGVFGRRLRLRTAGLLMLVTFIAFEAMAVGTAMPTAVAELDGLAWYGWVFSAYLVASVAGMVTGGDVGDRRGPRTALLAGVAVFAAGLLAAGLAGSMAALVAGRAVQGLGAGLIAVSLYVVAGQAYPARLRPALFGAFSTAWVLPALIGPLISGLVTTHASWRLVFLGLLPLVLAGLLLVLPALRDLPAPDPATRPRSAGPFWAALAGLGIVALQYAGQRRDGLALVLAVAGLAALGAGLRPLLPRGTGRAARGLPTVVASRGLLAGSFFGVDALLPLTLTELHGYGAVAAGIPLTAGSLGWAVASWSQGRRPGLSRVRLLRAGFVLLAVGVAGTALVAIPGGGGWPAYLTWAVAGLGMGLGMPSVGVLLFEHSPEHRRGADSAALQISDVTVSALCVGVVGVLVAAAAQGALPLAGAVATAVALLTAVAAAGAVIAPRAALLPAGPAAPPSATTLRTP